MNKLTSVLAVAAAVGTAWVAPASAVTCNNVCVGYFNGTTIANLSDQPSLATGGTSYGSFFFSVTAAGNAAPGSLFSNTIDIRTGGAGSLTVYSTIVGVTNPLGIVNYSSGFTTNNLPSGWSVVETTFYDPTNAAYGMADQLAQAMLNTSLTTASSIDPTISLVGPYSLTTRFVITALGTPANFPTVNNTINLQSVSPSNESTTPLPASLPLFASGLGALGIAGWRKRKKAKAAA